MIEHKIEIALINELDEWLKVNLKNIENCDVEFVIDETILFMINLLITSKKSGQLESMAAPLKLVTSA